MRLVTTFPILVGVASLKSDTAFSTLHMKFTRQVKRPITGDIMRHTIRTVNGNKRSK